MNLTSVLTLISAVGLFLYGMNLMGNGLKALAGASLERILEKLTSNRTKGFALGTVVTGIIQSSTATCIMLLGFLNADIMGLFQAIPVAMGSNIGSTVTGQILRLGDLSGGNFFLTMLKPSSFASLLIAYGVVVLVFVKSRKKKLNSVASVLLGLGILFFGMSTMEASIAPLREDPAFISLFTMFKNPLMAILAGFLVTAIVQSASASVGILQALTSTGIISWSMAIPIILGQNIGKCCPVLLGALGANKNAKRLTIVHLVVNLIGVVLIGGIIYLINYLAPFSFWNDIVNRGNVADFHSIFNVITNLLLLPISGALGRFSEKLIPDDKKDLPKHHMDQLDNLLLKTPLVALEAARKVTIEMSYAAKENFATAASLIRNFDESKIAEFEENEDFLDQAESKISDYLVKINTSDSNASMEATEILRTVGDLERIGDYCVNIYEMVVYNQENDLSFSETCLAELDSMNAAISNIMDLTVRAFETRNTTIAAMVEPLEEVVDSIKETIASRHIERLKNNLCSVQAGISLTEYLNGTERISDHCANIAVHAIRSGSRQEDFDTHSYRHTPHDAGTTAYDQLYDEFKSLYLSPIDQLATVQDELEAQRLEHMTALQQVTDVLDQYDSSRAAEGFEADDLTQDKKNKKDKKDKKDKKEKKDKKDKKDKKEKKSKIIEL